MIKIENVVAPSSEQWKAIIMGCRNPMNSWDKSDSDFENFKIGENDRDLMMSLRNAGTDHRKFMRMITAYADITAPLYWWKEYDTYKVGTVTNSCSTMRKIAEKEFTLDDFSHEYLFDESDYRMDNLESLLYEDKEKGILTEDSLEGPYLNSPLHELKYTIDKLNLYRRLYNDASIEDRTIYFMQIIQSLPSSYNQKRTVMLNYEVLANIYKSRKGHKLTEWNYFCRWIETLPYAEIITGNVSEN